MNWGRRSEEIFFSDTDREEFLTVLREAGDLWNLNISVYCLMANHYHLLVKTLAGNISRCMRHINGVYTQRFNRRNKKEGQLFGGRYGAVIVDKDHCLLEVLKYIHSNLLKAGLVKNLDDFYSLKNLPSMRGSSAFKEYIKEKFITLANRVEIPESKVLAPDVDKVISNVCWHFKVTPKEVLRILQGIFPYILSGVYAVKHYLMSAKNLALITTVL